MSKKSREAIRNNLSQAISPPSRTRRNHLDGLLDEYAPPETSQPAVGQPNAGQPIEPPPVSPLSQPVPSQPTVAPLNLLESVPDSAGYTKVPNRFYDHLCAQLTPDEQAVYSQLFRLSHGHHKDTCFVSNGRLSERSGIPLSTLKRVVIKLVGKGLIEKISLTLGPKKEQGVTYRVPAMSQLTVGQPRLSQPATGHNKLNQKETSKELASLDFQNCPDCRGSGFWYPKGEENGVARCRHTRLQS